MQFTFLDQIHQYGINIGTREIWLHPLYDSTGDNDEIDYRMSTTFCKNMFFLNSISSDPIIIHIHSTGGEWASGMAIFDAIKQSKSPTIIIGHAAVCSMATIIMQAATKRYLMPHADFMIHYGSIEIASDTLAATTELKQNQKYTNTMIEIFAKRAESTIPMGINYYKKIIKANINKFGNWWLTPDAAEKMGLIDGVIKSPIEYKQITSKRRITK